MFKESSMMDGAFLGGHSVAGSLLNQQAGNDLLSLPSQHGSCCAEHRDSVRSCAVSSVLKWNIM